MASTSRSLSVSGRLTSRSPSLLTNNDDDTNTKRPLQQDEFIPVPEGRSFTLRGTLVGLLIGLMICFSNMYFGLQTGWIGQMSTPSALIAFAFFRAISRYLNYPFSPVENVLVQSVAGSVGMMPLACGFIGVMPALNFLLTEDENGPLVLSTWNLVVFALGISFFGVVFGVPLRKEVIIRQKLKFPTGTATALMIKVLHQVDDDENRTKLKQRRRARDGEPVDGTVPLLAESSSDEEADKLSNPNDWKAKIRTLVIASGGSALFTFTSYFIPQLHNVPILGLPLANNWLWTFNPSPAYIGQGIIMGPSTGCHMLLGAIIGWGILSPYAKHKGWAPGPVSDFETGSRGWIIWISLAIMLADSFVNLGWLVLRPVVHRYGHFGGGYSQLGGPPSTFSRLIPSFLQRPLSASRPTASDADLPDLDAPPDQLVKNRTVAILLALSIVFCIGTIHLVFGNLIPVHATVVAVFFSLILSIMGVWAQGETDLNPVSGIAKITQLAFAVLIPHTNRNTIIINLLAGAVTESGALQAGDLMQDLKTGHILAAAPNAQFWGQMIGSFVGAVATALVYKLYTNVYNIPSELFQVPTAYVWIFAARLVTGKGLPTMAAPFALVAASIFTILTMLRIRGRGKWWQPWIPSGIAIAVGMYNTPSFTIARAVGGIASWYWISYKKREEASIIVLASGLILGEGVFSILNLILAASGIPHL